MSNEQSRIIPAAKWEEYHAWPTTSALRYMIFKANENGLAGAILRIGRRVLIDEAAFFSWVRSKGGARA